MSIFRCNVRQTLHKRARQLGAAGSTSAVSEPKSLIVALTPTLQQIKSKVFSVEQMQSNQSTAVPDSSTRARSSDLLPPDEDDGWSVVRRRSTRRSKR